jgi:hypothetical protein
MNAFTDRRSILRSAIAAGAAATVAGHPGGAQRPRGRASTRSPTLTTMKRANGPQVPLTPRSAP